MPRPPLETALARAVGVSLDPEEACASFVEALGRYAPFRCAAVLTDDERVVYSDGDPLAPGGEPTRFSLPGLGTLAVRFYEPLETEQAAAVEAVLPRLAVSLRGALAHEKLQAESEERASAQAASRVDRERLAALLRANPNATLVATADRRVTLANQAFCDLFGIPAPPDALVGADCDEAVRQSAGLFADPEAFLAGVDRVLAAREPVTSEALALADGRVLERDYVPVRIDGEYAGHLWEYRDATDRRRAALDVDRLRQFYEAVLESMPAQLAVFDPDGRYRYVTPSAIRDPEVRAAVIGRTDVEYARIRGLPDGVPARRMQTIHEVAHTQTSVHFEETFQTRAGETRHFVRFVTPVVDESGETTQVLGYGLDITERKLAEEALLASEALKRGVFESALDAVITIDTEGRVLEFNPAAEETFGIPAVDIVGEVMADRLIPERLRDAHKEGMARYLTSGEGPVLGVRIEVPALRASGEEFPCELAINSVRLDDREVFTATLRDITDRKAADDALRKSEARLRVALEVANLGTWDRTPEGEGDWDLRCRAIFGFSPDEPLTFDDFRERIHPEDLPGVDARLAAAFDPASDGTYVSEYRVVWPVGSVRWVATRGLVLFEGDGEQRRPVRFVGTAQDVTERHLAAEALEESESRYKQLVENSQELIYRADLSGVFTYANAVATHRTGYAEADLLGMPFWDLVDEEHRADVTEYYARQLAERVPTTYLEFPIRTARDEVLWIGQNVQLLEEDGQPVGVQAVARDVTERRHVMDELVAARETAERASRAREEFLANMSHEMRTPLNAVIGMSELLRSTRLDDEQRQFLAALSFSAEQLLALINDLLDVAKIESGRIEFERVPFQLAEVIDGVCEAVRFRAEDKGLDLTTTLADDVPRYLVGDPVRLSQILLNLLSNAVKFTERGWVRMSAALSEGSRAGDISVQFVVEDSGVGIPAAKLATVFERFTQARSDTTRRFGGTGLGLAIVRELTKRQGGTVAVESEEGRGTTFTITLPFAVAEGRPEEDDHEDADLSGARVLLVEDNPLNQFVARRMLEGWGAEVEVAENGREGVHAVERASTAGALFDLVLMDIQMPVMDGFEATRRIRQRHGPSALPILALTASALVEQRDQMEIAGMDGLVLKPFKPEHLRRRAAAAMGRAAAIPAESLESAQPHLVDLSNLEADLGGDLAFIGRLIDLFADVVPETVRAMEVALAMEDLPSLSSAAHKLKSSAGILGVHRLHALLSEVERLAEAGQPARLAPLVDETVATAAAAVDEVSRLRPRYSQETS